MWIQLMSSSDECPRFRPQCLRSQTSEHLFSLKNPALMMTKDVSTAKANFAPKGYIHESYLPGKHVGFANGETTRVIVRGHSNEGIPQGLGDAGLASGNERFSLDDGGQAIQPLHPSWVQSAQALSPAWPTDVGV